MSEPSVILLGSKPGSVVALEHMLERGWDIRAVVTSPDFNHDWLPQPSLFDVAHASGVKVYAKQSELPAEMACDFVISYMYRYRVKAPVIDIARQAALNFHAGPLPRYGGWAFYNIAILENATRYGCTCHHMDNGFDTGPLLKVREFPIDAATETAVSLEHQAQAEMVRLLAEFCLMAESGETLPRLEQNAHEMRYMTQEQFQALKEIPSDADAETIQRLARAFWYPPYECAFLRHNGHKVEIVPDIVKVQLAEMLHQGDLAELRQTLKSTMEPTHHG